MSRWRGPVLPGGIAAGAVRIHLYDIENVLRPRNSLNKESLSLELFERFHSALEYWTDPKYGDSRSRPEVLALLERNARQELELALAKLKE